MRLGLGWISCARRVGDKVGRLEIARSRVKLVLLLTGSVGFSVVVLWLLSGRVGLPPIVAVACYVAVPFCGVVAVIALRQMFDASPGLVVDAEGIIDDSSGVPAGRVFWSEMTGLRVVRIRRTRLLAIDVIDPQRFIAGASGMRRWAMAANARLYGTPVFISTVALRIRFDELVAILEARLR